ncbi:uncharacterized protein TNCV_2260121 [Trichonephila clavipes]|nr:uncharacterized protein TNCV_2260121 [Trichonephila clavipes]
MAQSYEVSFNSTFRVCGSPVVKVSDHDWHAMSSSSVPLRNRRLGQRCTLNLSKAETSSRVPPVEVQIEEKKRALSAQKPVELVCRAGGSRPPANITWFIGNQPLKGTKEKISSEGNITTGRLIFIPTIEDRGKNISCRAENMLIPGSAITDEWKVDVHCVLCVKPSLHGIHQCDNPVPATLYST